VRKITSDGQLSEIGQFHPWVHIFFLSETLPAMFLSWKCETLVELSHLTFWTITGYYIPVDSWFGPFSA